ncbi:ketopantoate reductase family protein [Bosea sp. NPDC055353]
MTMPAASDSVLIVGGGAIGGTLAASLAGAGIAVTVCDANAAHVAAINRDGLAVAGIRPAHVRVAGRVPEQLEGRFKRAFLAVKAKDNGTASAFLRAHLADDGWVAVLQNGLGMVEAARAIGGDRAIGAVIAIGAHYRAPGDLALLGYGETHVGELDGPNRARTREAAALLDHLQPAELTDNILGHGWGKLVLAAIYSATALADADVARLYEDPAACATLAAVGREVVETALAEGVTLEPADGLAPLRLRDPASLRFGSDDVWAGQRAAWQRYVNTRTGIWRDLAELHRRTEVSAMLGLVVDVAKRHGLATPQLEALLRLIADAETGKAALGPATFARLMQAENPTVLSRQSA